LLAWAAVPQALHAQGVTPPGAPVSVRSAAPTLSQARQPREGAAEGRAMEGKVTEKPAEKSAEKTAEKGAEKGAEKSSDKPTEKSAEKSAGKSGDKFDPNEDPMDRLRRRLAEKLAAEDAQANRNVLRVVTRPVAPEPPPPARPPRPRPAAAAAGAAAGVKKGADGHRHWAYEGEGGPERWAQMNPEWAQCGKGTRQSPIDIRDSIGVQLDPVLFDYRPSSFKVIDNGHTVQVNVAPGNSIEVIGRRYELLQFHFHRPSEERINGRQFDMVAHLVHKDPEGRLAVVAVLLDRGSAHAVVQTVWNNLPLEKNEEVPARAQIDLNALLPTERGYYTYMGSLTSPPCTEGVLWMVMKQPVGISPEQLAVFSRLYPMNARPVQAAAGRLIKGSK
jgi:carbonic anhydrase